MATPKIKLNSSNHQDHRKFAFNLKINDTDFTDFTDLDLKSTPIFVLFTYKQ